MKTRSCKIRAALLSALMLSVSWSAQSQAIDNSEPAEFNVELATPTIPTKRIGAVTDHMARKLQSLIDHGYDVELERDDQVIMVTIPLDNLFAPNGTSLIDSASKLLEPFIDYMRHYGKYKLLLAVHSDDTGSDTYRKELCEQRILSLYEFFERRGPSPSMLYGYAMGHDHPLVDDNSRKNRSLNRRLELYIVPGPELIANKKKK
ncbi:MAG: OmpA family protein [Clostridiales bacterium]|nr:OmpA family protein [Clostridiales bacterium]